MEIINYFLSVKKFFSCLSIIIALTFYSVAAHSGIYKWVDERGNAHFTDSPPQNQKTEEVELKINTYTSVQITPLKDRLGKTGKVVMYTASWCGICKQAKSYFVKNRIPHVTYDVEKSSTGRRDFKALGGKSVPVIILGKNRMNGFTVSKFDAAYKKQQEIDAEEAALQQKSNAL
ncbi:MAG: DUF4124 domain-containing protein [Gammaproteobacteria bacterium]|nr:DUF4124 domain-containing protein [Gammaproteobacteria bacterium]